MILFQNEYFLVSNKPSGIHTHESRLDQDTENWKLQLERELSIKLFPVHRLDKATSGVLIFAKSSQAAQLLQKVFTDKKMQKKYLAILRGPLALEGEVIRDMEDSYSEKVYHSHSVYQCLKQAKCISWTEKERSPIYSLAQLEPITGRTHQLRRHMAFLSRPILGDSTFGDTKENRYFQEKTKTKRLMLHARELKFEDPWTQKEVKFEAVLPLEFKAVYLLFHWEETQSYQETLV